MKTYELQNKQVCGFSCKGKQYDFFDGEKRQRNASVFTEISDIEGLRSVSIKVVTGVLISP